MWGGFDGRYVTRSLKRTLEKAVGRTLADLACKWLWILKKLICGIRGCRTTRYLSFYLKMDIYIRIVTDSIHMYGLKVCFLRHLY